jgi:hypothetical protein
MAGVNEALDRHKRLEISRIGAVQSVDTAPSYLDSTGAWVTREPVRAFLFLDADGSLRLAGRSWTSRPLDGDHTTDRLAAACDADTVGFANAPGTLASRTLGRVVGSANAPGVLEGHDLGWATLGYPDQPGNGWAI